MIRYTDSTLSKKKAIRSGSPINCPKIKCPQCKCETDEADDHAKKDPLSIHKDTDFDVTKMPIPDNIPDDSADQFVIDIGTYVPPVNRHRVFSFALESFLVSVVTCSSNLDKNSFDFSVNLSLRFKVLIMWK